MNAEREIADTESTLELILNTGEFREDRNYKGNRNSQKKSAKRS